MGRAVHVRTKPHGSELCARLIEFCSIDPDWNGFRPPGRKELYALEGDDDSEDELGGQEGDPMTFLVDAPLE